MKRRIGRQVPRVRARVADGRQCTRQRMESRRRGLRLLRGGRCRLWFTPREKEGDCRSHDECDDDFHARVMVPCRRS